MDDHTSVFLLNCLMHRIKQNKITPDVCKYCSPPCVEYNVRMFSKVFKLEILSNNDWIHIQSEKLFQSFPSLDIGIYKAEIRYWMEKHPELVTIIK